MKIPVLFANKESFYKDFEIFDVYDEERNAFNYTGRSPLIAHPPCRLFSRLRYFSNADKKELQCAYFALDKIRRFGGILEHPRSSTLWMNGNFRLNGSVDAYGGFLRSVDLSWFGFPARKPTMLYFCGISPKNLPPFPISFNSITHKVGGSGCMRLQEISIKKRSETPIDMINYFLEVFQFINC